MRVSRVARMGAAVVLCAAAVVVTTPGIAFAGTTECHFSRSEYGCETGRLPANSRYHAIWFEARAESWNATIECFVEDVDTLVIVGRATDNGLTPWYESRVIRGLYGTYRVRCGQRGDTWGNGGGKMRNDDPYVD